MGMVLVNYMAGITWIPSWLKHAPDQGLTMVDLVAPFFIFAVGLTYGLSFRRRCERDGFRQAVMHFLRRYWVLVGVGSVLSAGEISFGFSNGRVGWGVLQAIGVAGVLTLLVIRMPTWKRMASGLILLAIYQVLFELFWHEWVLTSPHGGLQGSLSWAAMLILSTVLADLFHDNSGKRKWFPWVCVLFVGAGLLLSLVVPISKNRVSASYVLVCLGLSGIVFAGFNLLVAKFHRLIPLLIEWGKNPFLFYILHLLFLGLFALPTMPWWYSDAPGWLVVVQMIFLIGSLSAIGLYLERKGWQIVL